MKLRKLTFTAMAIALVLTLVIPSFGFAQEGWLPSANSPAEANAKPLMALNDMGVAGVEIEYSFPEPEISTKEVNEILISLPYWDVTIQQAAEGFSKFTGMNLQQLGETGEPSIPYQPITVLLSPNTNLSTIETQVIDPQWEKVNGEWDVRPVPPVATWDGEKEVVIWPKGKNIVDGKDVDIYTSNAIFPAEPIGRVDTIVVRKWIMAQVFYAPYRYNPVERALYRLSGGMLQVTCGKSSIASASSMSDDIGRERIRKLVINYDEAIREYDRQVTASLSSPAHYVIITTSAIEGASTKLADFIASKESRGFTVQIITEGIWGGDTGDRAAENIRLWLQNNYAGLNIEYVLLIGNPNPSSGDVPMKMCYPQIYDPGYSECPTDFYFAELTSNWNSDNDSRFGEYYDDFSGSPPRGAEVIVGRIPYYGSISDLDHILSKIITYENTFLAGAAWRQKILLPMEPSDSITPGYHLGEEIKNSILIPKGWNYHRVYDEQYGLTPPPETTPCTITNVTDAWNGSQFGGTFWWTHGSATSAADVMDLTHAATLDDDHPGFTFQCSCLNGYPEASNNLQYSLLINGCVGTVSASRVSWYSLGQTSFAGTASNSGMTYEYSKRLITEEMPAGSALNDLKLSIAPGHQVRWMNYLGFNLYGCPSVGLFTINIEGAYVAYQAHQVNDAAGNNNGLVDSGESILLGMTLQNVGTANATSVSANLSTSDPYITITDNSQTWGDINAGASVNQSNAFAFNVANNITDQHQVVFQVRATGTQEPLSTWTSSFSITVNAPVLTIGAMTIDDATGNNNGVLDPGEMANIIAATSNNGHTDAANTTGTLVYNTIPGSIYITINTGSYNFGTLLAGASANASFSVSVNASTPLGTLVDFNYAVTSGAYSASRTFTQGVGITEIQVGTGTTSVTYPFYTYWMDTRTQSILLASEINSGGQIQKIRLYCSTRPNQNLADFYIRMQHTTLSSFPSTSFVNEGWTTVLHATNIDVSTWSIPGWIEFELTTPFNYDGMRNLLIDYCVDNSQWSSPSGECYSTSAPNRTLTQYQDLSTGNLLSCTTGSQQQWYNNVILVGALVPPLPPQITVNPTSINVTLPPGDNTTQMLTIGNTGEGALMWQVATTLVDADNPTRDRSGDVIRTDLSPEESDAADRTRNTASLEKAESVTLPFSDGFEDGNYDGWVRDGSIGTVEVTSATAAVGTYSFHYGGGANVHACGIHQEFNNVQPEYVSFYVRSGSTTASDGYFSLDAGTPTNWTEVIFFFCRGTGYFYVNADVGGDEGFAYQPNIWYHIEFRSIDWQNKNFDYYVNGQLIKADIPFRNASTVNSFGVLWLYNYDSSDAWWDEIYLGPSLAQWLTVGPPTSGVVPAGSQIQIPVGIDAAGFAPDEIHHANLNIQHNDPQAPNPWVVPANLTVTIEGAYVVYQAHQVNDSLGNNNGVVDSGESILLGMTLKNVGTANATGVSANLSTSDPYITITDNSQTWGNINAGTSANQSNAFAFNVANNITDQHVVNFQVTTTGVQEALLNGGGGGGWTSSFSTTVNAPVLTIGAMTIDDATGNNNGVLDPGETANVIVATSNNGHANAANTTGALTSSSSHITINTGSYNFGTLLAGASANASFSVSVSSSIPLGTTVDFDYTATSGAYSASQTFTQGVGISEIQVGTGTAPVTYPFHTYWMDTRTQSILLASEINSSGLIQKIRLYCSARPSQNLADFYIRMQYTTLGSFPSTSFVNEGWTTVLHATNIDVSTWTIPGWIEFTLTTPFYYDGTNNLLIDYCLDNSAWSSPSGECYSTSAPNRTLAAYSDLSTGNLLSCATGNQEQWYNNVILVGALVPPPQPQITVNPTSIGVALPPGGHTTVTLSIGNTGEGTLTYNISDNETSQPGELTSAFGSGSEAPADKMPSAQPRVSGLGEAGAIPQENGLQTNTIYKTDSSYLVAVAATNYSNSLETDALHQTLAEFGLSYVDVNSVAEAQAAGAGVLIAYVGCAQFNPTDVGNYIADGNGYIQIGDWTDWFANEWEYIGEGNSVTVTIRDPSHPVTTGLPDSWTARGFWAYGFGNDCVGWVTDTSTPNIGSLQAVGYSLHDRGISAATLGAGRAVYLGHNVYGDLAGSNDKLLFQNALNWAAQSTLGCPWLDENPKTGTVPPGTPTNIEITIDSANLTPGNYSANIIINHNDTQAPNPWAVPVTLTVGGERTLTMAVNGSGNTTPPVGIHTYAPGVAVPILATPSPGWQFVRWTGDVTNPNSANTTVTMDTDKTVIANFSTGTTVEVNSGNTITLAESGSQSGITLDIKGIPNLGPGNGMGGFTFDLSWNKDVIHVDNVTAAAIAGFSILPGTPNNTTGTVTVSGFSLGSYPTGNVTVAALGISAVGSTGNSTSLDVAITSLGDKNANPITATPIDALVRISNLVAETSVAQAKDSDDVVVVRINIDRIKEPSAGLTTTIPGGVGLYEAMASSAPAEGIQLLNVRGAPPFENPTCNPATGIFSASSSSPSQADNTTVAKVVPRLIGDANTTYDLTVAFQVIGAASAPELNVPEEHPNTLSFRRGDATKNGLVDIFDAMFIAQYIVGQRNLDALNVLNAASVKQDGSGGDKIDIFDAMFIAQYIVGFRNAYFVWLD